MNDIPHGLGSYFKKLFTTHANNEDVRETIEDLIEEAGSGDDGFSPHEQQLFNNLLYLKDKKVCRVMIPRADIVAFQQNGTVEELARLMVEKGHSRIPVYGESLDDVTGVLHIIDLAKCLLRGDGKMPVAQIAAPNLKIVSPDSLVPDLLQEMQQEKTHMAMVMDEYGGLCGLITIEDLLEEIVGDIEDEYDLEQDPVISLQENGIYVADAKAPLEDVEERTGISLFKDDWEEEESSVDTIGGYVFQLAQRIPGHGEIVNGPTGIRFKILEADPNRIKKIMIITTPSATGE